MQLRKRTLFPSKDNDDIYQLQNNGVKSERSNPETVTPSSEKQASPTKMVDKLSLFTMAGAAIVLCQVTCEVGKQLTNYSIQYYNQGKYPIPQTIIVVLTEIVKLCFTIARSKFQLPSFRSDNLKQSLKYLLPSVLYAVNNNIYFAGLILVPPPVWLILCSFRTVVTASIYKFFLKREVTTGQFVGAFLIVVSIAVAKAGDIANGGSSTIPAIPPAAFLLAVIAAINSVCAAVYTESLFKKEGENFLDQQFWLYFYGMFVASAVHCVTFTSAALDVIGGNFAQATTFVQFMLCLAVLLGGVGGMIVAAILKRLDNIVKEYSGATANMFTAIFCSFLFPEKFQFTIFIFMAMCLLFTGIYLYETRKPKPKSIISVSPESREEKAPLMTSA